MRVHVGPFAYTVKIVQAPFIVDGAILLGQARYLDRAILISSAVPADRRMEVLTHELKHAWHYHVPIPHDAEEDAQLSALITSQLLADLAKQGGAACVEKLLPESVEALEAEPKPRPPTKVPEWVHYIPVRVVEAVDSVAVPSGGRAQCGRCELIVAAGAIVNSEPEWSHKHHGVVVKRTLYCSHCNQLQSWVEACSFRGVPNGAVVEEPTWQDGDKVDEFLREHPQAAGVMVD